MKIEDWPPAKDVPAFYRELKELDLLEHLAKLEAFGYTILPSEMRGSKSQLEETKTAVMRIAAARKSPSVDVFIQDVCVPIANEGYLALATNLYHRPADRALNENGRG